MIIIKKSMCILAMFTMVAFAVLAGKQDDTNAAVRISDKQETLIVGQKYKLKVKILQKR